MDFKRALQNKKCLLLKILIIDTLINCVNVPLFSNNVDNKKVARLLTSVTVTLC